ncbi:MAG: DUF3604 domain-containing protein [Victivallales bacterium]|nr:DUF3604 domain-containing protein [Victivallales bacterium]
MKLGKAEIDINKPVVAGSHQKIIYTFEVEHAIDDTGYLKIVFRYAGDFGTPQFNVPAAENFCSVSTNGDCRLDARWDPKGHTRPWGKALYLKIMGGYLDKGERIVVVFGDDSQGSPGWRMQTFCEETFEFKTFLDPFATYQFKELSESPTLKIIQGDPVKAVCVAPSQVMRDASFTVFLRLEDRWGNAIGDAVPLKQPGFKRNGVCTVECVDEVSGLKAVSNPIQIVSEHSFLSRWWADFHGQSEETIGTNSIDDYFKYARDCSKLDIGAHQGNDFQSTDQFWEKINQTTGKFNKSGEFVTFPGYEWSGNTPLGGDRNVYHKNEGAPIYRSSHDLLPNGYSAYPASPTASDLFEKLNSDTSFVFAHVGGRYADVAQHKENLEVAMEVHSAWGTFEWLVEDAFGYGWRIGICANSDGHKCRPGASYPGASKFGSYGGLTCVLSERLDRESVFQAMKSRHFYATTGNRLLMDVEIIDENGRGAAMGDVFESDSETYKLNVSLNGTAPIDYVEIRNGVELIDVKRPYGNSDFGGEVKVVWSGAEVKGRDRMTVWNGSLKTNGNKIKSFVPVNFWNPDSQPSLTAPDEINWRSITTGGVAGVIADIERPFDGELNIKTNQINCDVDLSDLGESPIVVDAGGLMKKLEIYRLPRESRSECAFSFSVRIDALNEGDNPIYLKVVQRDGHMAWSSPVYLVSRHQGCK